MTAIAPKSRQILIVEDNDDVRTMMNGVIQKMGYQALEARTMNRALRLLSTESIDMMLMDIYLQGTNGLDLLRGLKRRNTAVPTVVVSGFISDTMAHQLISLGVDGMVSKPFTLQRLTDEIKKVATETSQSGAIKALPISPDIQTDDERRDGTRIPTHLPVRMRTRAGKRFYMKLVDINTTGMQTHSKNLDIIKQGSEKQGFAFEIPIVARLAWVKTNPDSTFCIGWEFDEALCPNDAKTDNGDAAGEDDPSEIEASQIEQDKEQDADISGDKRRRTRILLQVPIRARIGKNKYSEMKLIDISSTGMQTCSDDLTMLNTNTDADSPNIAFEIPITARLVWVNATAQGTYTIGWEFEHPIEQ
ncbi:MAG: response regulator [Candidatus Latescibacteria bacterium]|nr:response regulator [Candidatus Latescibacterota bacterium]